MTHEHGVSKMRSAFVIGVLLNIIFVLVEFYFGLKAHSLSLMADAGHNLSDVGALLLAWGATWMSQRKANERHTFGWQRGSIVSALVNSVLLTVAMAFMIWEGVGHLLSGGGDAQAQPMLIVGGAGIVINGVTAALFSANAKDLNLRGVFLHAASDALTSAAVVAGGLVYSKYGWRWVDPALSVGIALVVILGSVNLFRKSLHLIFEGVPESIDLSEVEKFLLGRPGVESLHDLHVWAISTSKIALSVHLVIPSGAPGDDFLAKTGDELRKRFSIDHLSIQIEQGTADVCAVNPELCK